MVFRMLDSLVALWGMSGRGRGGACGAALLAGTGVGAWATVDDACNATVRVAETIHPKHADVMGRHYAHYRKLYPALRQVAG